MKQFYFIIICLLVSCAIIAQEKTKLPKEEKERREKNIQAANPFAKFGYKAKVATLSKGKYLEVHDLDSIVTIGSVRFHVDKKEIVGFIQPDTINGEYSRPIGDIASRWLSPDPLAEEFPSWSPYTFSFDNPLRFVDPDGQAPEDIIFIIRGKTRGEDRSLTYKGGNFYWNDTKKVYDGKGGNSTLNGVLGAYRKIEKSGDNVLKNQLHTLENSKNSHYIEVGSDNSVEGAGIGVPKRGDAIGTQTTFNLSKEEKARLEKNSGVPETDLTIVAHEMRHQFDYDTGNMKDRKTPASNESPQEIRGVNNENRARKIENLPMRTTYGGKKIDPEKLKNPPNN